MKRIAWQPTMVEIFGAWKLVDAGILSRYLPPGATDTADQALWSPGQVNLEGEGVTQSLRQ